MILGIILALTGSLFYRTATKLGLNKVLWAIVGILSYFITQFITGLVTGLLFPDLLVDRGSLILIGLVSGVVGVALTYVVMLRVAKKANVQRAGESELIDDSL